MQLRNIKLKRFLSVFFCITFFELIIFSCLYVLPTFASADLKDESVYNFVTIYDNAKVRTIKTDAKTVREALKRVDLKLSSGDIVEPAQDERINAQYFNINIYRAQKVVVRGDSRQVLLRTATRDPRLIAKKANFNLRAEDQVKHLPHNNFLESGILTSYEIKRAKKVNFTYYGEKLLIYTQAQTVQDFFKERGITLRSNDWISSKLSDNLRDGMSLALYRQGKQTVVQHEEINFEEKITYDYARDSAYRQVTRAGEKGRRDLTFILEMKDGVELSRDLISTIIVKEPVTQEVTIGAKPKIAEATNLPPGSHQDWMAAAGISPSDYGYVNFIISKESSWRTTASNGRYFGLYQTSLKSLASQCPNWQNDPVCQLRAASKYMQRYGTWKKAYDFWHDKKWW